MATVRAEATLLNVRASLASATVHPLPGNKQRPINDEDILRTQCARMDYADDWEKLFMHKNKARCLCKLKKVIRTSLDENEKAALNEIASRAKRNADNSDHSDNSDNRDIVCGVLIECITSDGQFGYSPVFLHHLRRLGDRLKLWLILDETMTALRCASFFMYQLLPRFVPDYVIFGKALGVSGLAAAQDKKRIKAQELCQHAGYVSVQLYESDVRRFQRRCSQFDADHVFRAGSALKQHIESRMPKCEKHCFVRGFGCLLALGSGVKLRHCEYSFYRLLPMLDISDEDIRKVTVSSRCAKCK